jgi:hypothetical protein
MNAEAEAATDVDENLESANEGPANDEVATSEEQLAQNKSEFALKLVNAVKAMNSGEFSYHEMINSFVLADELKCLFLFLKALPYNPISRIYPETPFLIFKGVVKPDMFDLSEETVRDIENYMKGQNSEYYTDLRLHDLDQYYLDAYESAVRIYNDMAERTRNSYQASVKQAKSQVIEISAVFVCLVVIAITLFGISQ